MHLITDREAEIVTLVAKSLTNRQIAKALDISTSTVETHRGNVRDKLGSGTSQELTMFALARGWVDNPYLVPEDNFSIGPAPSANKESKPAL